jgi:hypothetical protein
MALLTTHKKQKEGPARLKRIPSLKTDHLFSFIPSTHGRPHPPNHHTGDGRIAEQWQRDGVEDIYIYTLANSPVRYFTKLRAGVRGAWP